MRKLCTRRHFIEHLGYNFVEKQALLARCTWERHTHDFGKDGYFLTYADNGEPEEGMIEVQVKSTDNIERYKGDKTFFFDVEKRDLDAWSKNFVPLLLVLYDAQNDLAFYLEVRENFKRSGRALDEINKFVRVYIPAANLLNPDAVRTLRQFKNDNL